VLEAGKTVYRGAYVGAYVGLLTPGTEQLGTEQLEDLIWVAENLL